MTREQTIEKLKALYTNAVAAMLRADACDDDESAKVMTEYAETLDSAINALETALQTDGDCISRRVALDALYTKEQETCEYCHEDSDGYVKPIEKNSHAFIHFGMNGWCLELSAKGWHGETKINYCPMCGRRLRNG